MDSDIDYTHNSETQDDNGNYIDIWSPWEAMGHQYFSYSSEVDMDALRVLKGIIEKKYCTDIAKENGMAPAHVEMIQYLFCGANWVDYGTSPRGCWISFNINAERLLAKFEEYYEASWRQKPDYGTKSELANIGKQ